MNIIYGYGDKSRTFKVLQKRTDPSSKIVLKLDRTRTNWEVVYEGDLSGSIVYLKRQKKYAEAADFRKTVADMCGTSYRAAMEDMGL